jgi:hypothetical protein
MGNTAKKLKSQAAPSFAAIVAGAKAEPKASAKKSTIPPLGTTDEIKKVVDRYQDAKTNAKQAEAVMAEAGEAIIQFTREHQDKEGFAGRYSNSYVLAGVRHTAKVIWTDRFSINAEDGPELADILGASYPEMVQEKVTVKLRDEVFADEALQNELMAAVGAKFTQFFTIEKKLVTTEGFAAQVYRKVAPEQLPALRTFAKQFKPSIR